MNYRTHTLLLVLASCLPGCVAEDNDDDSMGATDAATPSTDSGSAGESDNAGESENAGESDEGRTREIQQCVSIADCSDGAVEFSHPICASAGGASAYVVSNSGCELACLTSSLNACISTECAPTGEACECDDPDAAVCDADGGSGGGPTGGDGVSPAQCDAACDSFDRCLEADGDEIDPLICPMLFCPSFSEEQATCLADADGDCDAVEACTS